MRRDLTPGSPNRPAWDHGGKSSRARGYGREHRRLRAELLKREPLCRMCIAKNRVTPATIADHIVSIAKGGPIHDPSNLQPLCKRGHDDKSLLEQGKRVKRTIGADGWPIE